MKIPERLEKLIDATGLVIALVVDLIVIPICMITIAPDFLTKIAFVCIGETIVLFVFRSWAKGQIPAWIIFAATVFFFDFSFSLIATESQTNKKSDMYDAEIVRIDNEIEKANQQIAKLQEERTISTRPETIKSISDDIDTENSNIREFKDDRKVREKELKKTGGIYITADSVFNAIPQAIQKKRYLPLFVFGLMFLGLQAVVVTSIDSQNKQKKKKLANVSKESNEFSMDDWIRWAWRSADRLGNPVMLSPYSMKECAHIAGKVWDEEKHNYYLDKVTKAGLVDTQGKVVGNAENAIKKLENEK